MELDLEQGESYGLTLGQNEDKSELLITEE